MNSQELQLLAVFKADNKELLEAKQKLGYTNAVKDMLGFMNDNYDTLVSIKEPNQLLKKLFEGCRGLIK